MERVEHHVIGVAVHERAAVDAGLDIEVRVSVIHPPLLVSSLARLLGVLKQRSLLCEESRVR
eukprot:6200766-Pleurochrysis_carterae.AAC.1